MSRIAAPRDAQRARVYRAETGLPSSPLPGLAACSAFADRVVGSLWWQLRFPEHRLDRVPRFRPGNGARQAFFRVDADGPTITLPRRYRTKGVVLHELAHWALGLDSALPHHGSTFTRVLADLTAEFCGDERATNLEAAFARERVRVGARARPGPGGRLHYGFDERLRLGRGQTLAFHVHGTDGPVLLLGTLERRTPHRVHVRGPAGIDTVASEAVFAIESVS